MKLFEVYSGISLPSRINDDVADLYEAIAVGRGNVCFGAISVVLTKAEADGDVVAPATRLDVEMEGGFIDIFRSWGVVFAVNSVVEVLGNVVGELGAEPADAVDGGVFESAAFVVQSLHGFNKLLLAAHEAETKQEERKTKKKGNPP